MQTHSNSSGARLQDRLHAALSNRQSVMVGFTVLAGLAVLAGLILPSRTVFVEAGSGYSNVSTGPGSAVVFSMDGSGETQIYGNNGAKLAGIAYDDLYNLAAAGAGKSITIPTQDGTGTLSITYEGGGLFAGTFGTGSFSFRRSDVSGASCNGFRKAIALARTLVLPAGYERTVAEAVHPLISAAC